MSDGRASAANEALAGPVAQVWFSSRPTRVLVSYVIYLGFWVWLGLLGFPPWRVAAGLLVLATVAALFVLERSGRLVSFAGDIALTGSFINVAVTGGVRSPFLVLGVIMGALYVLRHGRNRASDARIAGYGLGLAALTLGPSSWAGPPLPDPVGPLAGVVFCWLGLIIAADNVAHVFGTVERATAEMLRARDELASQALGRARELELLSSKLSHELKNPLAAIKALVQVCARESQGPGLKRLEVVQSEVERMSLILQEYLSFSRPVVALAPVRVSLARLADDVLLSLGGRAQTGRVRLAREGDVEAWVDPRRLKEALLNLVANALEATAPGGRVTVVLSPEAGGASLEVRDTGKGMSSEMLAHLGSPFFTTREGGTGLGVLLARAVFTQHGGRLDYRSAPGEGTTAHGHLPPAPDLSAGRTAVRAS